MAKNLKQAVLQGIQKTGYPLEQRVGKCLERHGWEPFYSITYIDPADKTQRELDIMAYKEIQYRRIELRISCKRSTSKPWVFFTDDFPLVHKSFYLKMTPVSADRERYLKIPKVLKELPFFSCNRIGINYTALFGGQQDKEARPLVRDGLYSALTSVYHDIYPFRLMFDRSGTIYFFVLVFDGSLFESYYDSQSDKDIVNEATHILWKTFFPLARVTKYIQDHNGDDISLSDVIFWFSEDFIVEVVLLDYFEQYLQTVESVFRKLREKDLLLFGDPWIPENFPKIVKGMPDLKPKPIEKPYAT
jgi:hypothetical protein